MLTIREGQDQRPGDQGMEGKARIIFPVLATDIVVFVVSCVVTFSNIGLRSDFIPRWLFRLFYWLADRLRHRPDRFPLHAPGNHGNRCPD